MNRLKKKIDKLHVLPASATCTCALLSLSLKESDTDGIYMGQSKAIAQEQATVVTDKCTTKVQLGQTLFPSTPYNTPNEVTPMNSTQIGMYTMYMYMYNIYT